MRVWSWGPWWGVSHTALAWHSLGSCLELIADIQELPSGYGCTCCRLGIGVPFGTQGRLGTSAQWLCRGQLWPSDGCKALRNSVCFLIRRMSALWPKVQGAEEDTAVCFQGWAFCFHPPSLHHQIPSSSQRKLWTQCQLAIPAACWAAGNIFPGISGLGTFTLSTLPEVVRVLSALIPVKSKDG